MMRTRTLGALALLAASPAFAQTARVQLIHNCADTAATLVDVWLNGSLLLDDFAFRTASPFMDAPADSLLTVGIASDTSTSAASSFFTQDLTLDSAETYVIVANGIVSATGYNPMPPFSIDVFTGAREAATSGATNTDILVCHGSTDAPMIDVNEVLVLGGATWVDDIAYNGFQGYIEAPTLDYWLEISSGGNPMVTYEASLAAMDLDSAAVTILANGFLDPSVNSDGAAFGLWMALAAGGPLVELPALVVGGNARVQLIHNSADTAATLVDVWVDGSLLLDDLAFRTASAFMDMPADSLLTVGIAPDTSTSAASSYFTQDFTLDNGETYVLVVNGIVSATGYNPMPPLSIDVFGGAREAATSGTTNTDLLVCHGSTDAPVIDVNEVLVLGGATWVDDIAYNGIQGYIEVPTMDYGLQITSGGNPVATYEASLATMDLDSAAVTILASGFLDPSVNSDGAAFGLWMALAAGGPLVELPELVALPNARVQLIHNSADLAADVVDVWLDNSLLLDNFAFRTASPFLDVQADIPFVLGIAPDTSLSASESIYTETFTLTDGETYVIAANGVISATGYTPLTPFSLDVFDQALESADDPANTDVLVLHGSTDAPTIDLYEPVLDSLLLDDVAYAAIEGYMELPTDDYTVQVRTADNSSVIAAYSAPLQTMNLQDDAVTVVASGFLDPAQNSNGPDFGLWVAMAAGGPLVELQSAAIPQARLQLIQNCADLGASEVDVYLNGALLIDDFAFRTATAFGDVQSGTDLSIAVAPSTSTSVADAFDAFAFNFVAGSKHIAVVSGIVSGAGYDPAPALDLIAYTPARETATSGATNTDILVFHGSTDAPAIDVNETALLGGATLVNGLGYGEFNGYLEPPCQNFVFEVSDGNTPLASYSAPLVQFGVQGDAITVLASGFLNPAVNSNGPGFGLWAAVANGGPLVELPVFTHVGDAGMFAGTSLWPNPADREVNVFVPALRYDRFEAEVLDAAGRTVRSPGSSVLVISSDRIVIPTAELRAGSYLLRLTGSQDRITLPLIVTH